MWCIFFNYQNTVQQYLPLLHASPAVYPERGKIRGGAAKLIWFASRHLFF